jgi:flotillin
MPTVEEVTLAHSRRLSEIHRRRDRDMAGANGRRDRDLAAVPAAKPALDRHRDALRAATATHDSAVSTATARREGEIARARSDRSAAIEAAEHARRSADLASADARLAAERAAEEAFRQAISRISSTLPLAERRRLQDEADRVRREALDKARRDHDTRLTAADAQRSAAVEQAMRAAGGAERIADVTHDNALRMAETARRQASQAAATRLVDELAEIPDARAVLDAFRETANGILARARAEERAEFERLRRELDEVRRSTHR